MTIAELQRRVEALEAEVRALRGQAVPGGQYVPGFGPIGGLADDPGFDEFTRLVRKERERANRESLEEFDREREAEQQAEAKKKRPKKTPKPVRR